MHAARMILVLDLASPLLAERGRTPRWVSEIARACDDTLEAEGPDEVFERVRARGDVRDVVCVGRASTTSAVLSGVWAGGGEWRTLTVRHIGGPGPDPYVAALGLPLEPAARWARLREARGTKDVPLLRVDDVGYSAARLGLVAGAGAGAGVVRAATRAEVGLRGWIGSARQAVSAVRSAVSDDVVFDVAWTERGGAASEASSLVLASTVPWSVGGYELVAADQGELSALSLVGAGSLAALGRPRRRSAQSASFRAAPRVALDGWSLDTPEERATTLSVGPRARFFVPASRRVSA